MLILFIPELSRNYPGTGTVFKRDAWRVNRLTCFYRLAKVKYPYTVVYERLFTCFVELDESYIRHYSIVLAIR